MMASWCTRRHLLPLLAVLLHARTSNGAGLCQDESCPAVQTLTDAMEPGETETSDEAPLMQLRKVVAEQDQAANPFCCWWPKAGTNPDVCSSCTSKQYTEQRFCQGDGTWCTGSSPSPPPTP